jgi:hypothetical protein
VDVLLPTSSESESESEEEGKAHALPSGAAALEAPSPRREKKRRRDKEPSRKDRKKKKRIEDKEKRRMKGDSRRPTREEKEPERRRSAADRDVQAQIELERRLGQDRRAGRVGAWASGSLVEREPYYFDRRPDPGNVAFGSLYRGDVAAYRRFDPGRVVAGREDGKEIDDATFRPERDFRYWGPAAVRAERSARLRRWRRGGGSPAADARASLPSSGFLSLDPARDAEEAQLADWQRHGRPSVAAAVGLETAVSEDRGLQRDGESAEERILRRTREFNRAVRERPEDLHVWLDFAAFQDEAAALGPRRRGAERATAEKKLAVLERALRHHPASEELLLALLETAAVVCDEDELARRWAAVLARHGGSAALWNRYLDRRKRHFAGFSVPVVSRAFAAAVGALAKERDRVRRGGAPGALAAAESELVAVLLAGAQLLLQSGQSGPGISQVQILLEYNFAAPEGENLFIFGFLQMPRETESAL